MFKALWKNFGKVINVSVYAPKAGALPSELHLADARFVLLRLNHIYYTRFFEKIQEKLFFLFTQVNSFAIIQSGNSQS